MVCSTESYSLAFSLGYLVSNGRQVLSEGHSIRRFCHKNYVQMVAIFGGSQATGRFAMGSNEPLGSTMGPIDSDNTSEGSD
jgi:hypothetical protein